MATPTEKVAGIWKFLISVTFLYLIPICDLLFWSKTYYGCIMDTSNGTPDRNILHITEEEQLIQVSAETSLKIKFPTMSLTEFWIGVEAE